MSLLNQLFDEHTLINKNVNLHFCLSKCVHQIIDLADSNKDLMMLSSKYKVIREEIIYLMNIDDEE